MDNGGICRTFAKRNENWKMSKRKPVDLLLEGVTIEAVAAEGKALTHYEGIVVFVDFAVPGDVVDIRVFKKKKNYMEGRIERIVQPSP